MTPLRVMTRRDLVRGRGDSASSDAAHDATACSMVRVGSGNRRSSRASIADVVSGFASSPVH